MWVPVVVLLIVITLPEEPETVKVETVWVVPVVKRREWAAVPVSLKSVKVLDPEIVILEVLDPWLNHRLL